jgi:phage baseplate assembly protein W
MSFDLELLNGDITIKGDGTVRTVSETPKLRQDILKILLTSIGSNQFHPWYGCAITDSVMGRNYAENLMVSAIKTSISQSLDRLKTLQMSQASSQKVSLAEMIAEVVSVDVGRDLQDPRQLNIRVVVLTRRLTQVEEVFTLVS